MINNIQNRQIPIFISSTFQDMQAERDELIKKTFPKLRELAKKHMATLTPIDLRWGITSEEAKTGKVLELCLYEIERCNPFFIGILGDRYGWSPALSDLSANNMLLEQYEWLRQDIEDGLSITEIEMQFAVLRKQQHGFAFFFIKNGGQNNHPRDGRLQKLIDKIKSGGQELRQMMESRQAFLEKCRWFYACYDAPEDLTRQLELAMTSLIQHLFPIDAEEDEWFRENMAQLAYLQELTECYVPAFKNETSISSFLIGQGLTNYQMITSDERCFYGKSAFIANWIKNHQDNEEFNIIYHFIGVGFLGGDYRKILKRICREVCRLYALEMPAEDNPGQKTDFSDLLSGLLRKINNQKSLVIIIDGLQHLPDCDDSKMLDWLPVVADNVTLVLETPLYDPTYKVYDRRFNPMIHYLYAFDEQDEREFVKKYLEKYGKRLSYSQTVKILNAYAAATPTPYGPKNILTLKSLLNELIVFGSHEQLDERIAYYCEGHLEKFYPRMLGWLEDDFGHAEVVLILSLIVYSMAGLSEQEIIEISQVTVIQWSNIFYSISHLLTLRDGRYYIDKYTITMQIAKRYALAEKAARQMIISYFNSTTDYRAIEERLFQFGQLERFDDLYNTINPPHVFDYLYNNNFAVLMSVWKMLYESPYRSKYLIGNCDAWDLPVTTENAHIFANLAQFAKQVLGDVQSAQRLFTKSRKMYESAESTDYETMAEVCMALSNYDEALANIDKAIAETLASSPVNRRHYSQLISSKATMLFKVDKTDEAIGLLREALELKKEDDTDNITLGILRNLAVACCITGDDCSFKEYIEKAITLTLKKLGDKHLLLADVLYTYASCHERVGHKVEAIGFYQKALEIFKKWYPENHKRIIEAQNSIDELSNELSPSLEEKIFVSLFGDLPDWDRENLTKEHPLPKKEFLQVLDFHEGIADDLYLADEGWEDGMKEYAYRFRCPHDCYIEGNRYEYNADGFTVYVCVDADGQYVSVGKAFDNLKDAQVHFLMHRFTFYEQYCDYKNI